ncbi:hypothetical protein V3851_13320 [Paenibacillus sp. M1]|uniref:Phage holin n=1 Tax=Paenibacillus haidiansis TaxID=1574488 RepID=A0ABU7VST4_9BACL
MIVIKAFKHWAVKMLVFIALFQILFFLLKNVLFNSIHLAVNYENVVQMVSAAVIVLVAALLTSYLTNNDS